jgi:hypothetical protein
MPRAADEPGSRDLRREVSLSNPPARPAPEMKKGAAAPFFSPCPGLDLEHALRFAERLHGFGVLAFLVQFLAFGAQLLDLR